MADDVAQWVRVHAAKQGRSVSRLIGEMVEDEMRETEAYEAAMNQYLSRQRAPLGGHGQYPSRKQLHDRGANSWARER